jgi:H+/Cl- antiporter ClcA
MFFFEYIQIPISIRPYLIAFGINFLFFLGTWFLNNGKGLFFFAIDELGLMMLLPLVFIGNTIALIFALLTNKLRLAKAFGFVLLSLLVCCTGVWTHGYKTGVSF